MLQCAGALDGSHIPITPPAHNHTDKFNRKGWNPINLQGVVIKGIYMKISMMAGQVASIMHGSWSIVYLILKPKMD